MSEKISIDKSIGNDNRYIHWCDAHEQRRYYGACLFTVAVFKDERNKTGEDHGDCASAISKGRCNAVWLREREVDEGAALYFEPRKQIVSATPPVVRSPAEKHTSASIKPACVMPESTDFSKLVTDMTNDEGKTATT